MPFPPAGEMVITLNTTTATASIPGNTAAAATGWALASGSSYITSANTSADTIVISFDFNVINVGLWCTADGGIIGGVATAGGTNCIYFPPTDEGTAASSGTGLLEGVQAIPNWNVINGIATYRDGVTKAFDQSLAVGATAQSGMTGLHLWNTAPNWLSFCPDSATAVTGHVTVTFQ